VRYGESSVGAVDFGLIGYVSPLFSFLAHLIGKPYIRVFTALALPLICRSYLNGIPLSRSMELRREFYQDVIRIYKRYVTSEIIADN
jgi:hypothetical protein